MEHRGIDYQVQELADRWKWTVFVNPTKTWTGISKTRAAAVLDAELAIDRIFKQFLELDLRTLC